MSRLLMISSDCHAGTYPGGYDAYMPQKYHDSARRWWIGYAREMIQRAGTFFDQEAVESFTEETGEAGWLHQALDPRADLSDDQLTEMLRDETSPFAPRRGEFDPEVRLADLEGDGVVGEVVFPQMAPFGAGLMQYRREIRPEHNLAGVQAYNRWLADFCNTHPGRHAGVALINLDDIDVTLAEIARAKEAGLFGGVLLPTSTGEHPFYHDKRYEPLWAACADLEMPLHSHSGWTPDYGDDVTAAAMFIQEVDTWAHRPFGALVWSGVFERHPKLRFIMTEAGCSWILSELRMMEHKWDNPIFAHFTTKMSLRPREYFQRQCWLGASFLAPHEGEDRHRIGVERLMYGTDYPHIEGTWPNTMTEMRKTFAGYDEKDVRLILGANAAEAYDFDLGQLGPLAERLGPELDSIRSSDA